MVDDAKTWTTRIPPEVYQDPQFSRKYLIERELGMGGAGVVVCARHRELDERVAIKFLLPGGENSSAIARFRREARAANRVKNEHVVRIIDVSTTDAGVPYVVMEYLEGVDLERMLLESPNRQLPVRDAIEFVLQACEALAECHRIGIVHRDLKPSNLFCAYGADGLPLIKVLDFGISKLASTLGEGVMTGKHGIVGSPRYMSPEQYAAPADVDLRTDIWALGVILYELVTGAAPFAGSTVIKLWENVKMGVPATIDSLRRDAPLALGPIVRRCLEKKPEKRYQNVAELAKALLPLGPDRSRSSVARIVRVVESPGSTTASLALPLPLTHDAVAPTSHPPLPSKPEAVLMLLAALGVGGAALVAVSGRQKAAEAPSRVAAPGAAASSVNRGQAAAPASLPSAPSLVGESLGATAGSVASPAAVLSEPNGSRPQPAASQHSVVAPPPVLPSNGSARPASSSSRPAVASAVTAVVPSQPVSSAAAPAPSATSSALVPPVAATSAPAHPSHAPATPSAAPSAKWLVDIVEQRKPRGGAREPK